MGKRLSIGDLASATGVKVNTIRFYEGAGVLPQPSRTASGQRTYEVEDLKRLRFVRRTRELGFNLDEVRSLLDLSGDQEGDCAEVNAIAVSHLRAVEIKIERLSLLREELARMTEICAGGRVAHCQVLEVLGNEAGPPPTHRQGSPDCE